MKQNGSLGIFAGIILTILILGGVSLYYFGGFREQAKITTSEPTASPAIKVTPSESTPEGWQVYTNTLIGFSIAYPNNTKVPYTVQGSHGGQTIDVNGSEDNTVINFPGNHPDYENSFLLEILPYTGTLENAPSTAKRLSWMGENKLLMPKSFIVDNIPTIWYEYPPENPSLNSRFEIFLVKNNHVFIFQSTTEVSATLMEQILSTLKFTPQKPSQ